MKKRWKYFLDTVTVDDMMESIYHIMLVVMSGSCLAAWTLAIMGVR